MTNLDDWSSVHCDLCNTTTKGPTDEDTLRADHAKSCSVAPLDEYDGHLIAGVRYANTFTFNLARLSRITGANEERQRIVQLLEQRQPKCNIDFYNGNGCDCVLPYHDLLALIKGTTK